jgi:hypothetical protein
VLQKDARKLGITLQPLSLRDPDETDLVFAALPADTNGFLVENTALNLLAQERICLLATQRRLSAVSTFREFAAAVS